MPALLIFLLWVGAIIYFARQQEEETDFILLGQTIAKTYKAGFDYGVKSVEPTLVAPIVRVTPGINITALYAETFTGLRHRERLPDEYVARGMAKDLAREIIDRRAFILKKLEDYPENKLRYCMKIAIVTEEIAIDGIK